MRNRLFALNTVEVALPVILAVILGIGAIAFLSPETRAGGTSAGPDTVRIYSSLPLPNYDSMVHGIQMALEEASSKAGSNGQFKVEYVSLNDATERADGSVKWDADVELANARRAAEDPDAMVYIGTYNSGAAKISIPVLNRVHMAMVSPGNTYPGLTKPGTGTAGEPWVYYPLGIRNYFRVVPADDLQGAAAAAYARELDAKSVYVLDDTELYGHGIAQIFAQSARDLGLQVLGGPEGIDVRQTSYGDLAAKITQLNPGLVYFGGITDNHAALVLRDLRNAGYQGIFMGADGIADNGFIEGSGRGTLRTDGPVYSTLVGLPATKLTGAGADWYNRYKSRYPNDNNEDFASFGYEAARVALNSISKADKKDREAVRAAMAQTNTNDMPGEHILGDYSFDANGDTSLVTISVQQMSDKWEYQGLMQYDPTTKQWSFQSK